MRNDRKNIVVEKSFQLALLIVEYVDILEKAGKWVIAKQLLKSGTSIGANVREAQNAESKQDFIHKMKIAAKEADETSYWLELCEKCEYLPSGCEKAQLETKQITMLLSKIIASSKRK